MLVQLNEPSKRNTLEWSTGRGLRTAADPNGLTWRYQSLQCITHSIQSIQPHPELSDLHPTLACLWGTFGNLTCFDKASKILNHIAYCFICIVYISCLLMRARLTSDQGLLICTGLRSQSPPGSFVPLSCLQHPWS